MYIVSPSRQHVRNIYAAMRKPHFLDLNLIQTDSQNPICSTFSLKPDTKSEQSQIQTTQTKTHVGGSFKWHLVNCVWGHSTRWRPQTRERHWRFEAVVEWTEEGESSSPWTEEEARWLISVWGDKWAPFESNSMAGIYNKCRCCNDMMSHTASYAGGRLLCTDAIATATCQQGQ